MINNDNSRPIFVMDSGIGGISVLREAARLLPSENFIYYGDSLNAPYGTKSTEEVRELTLSIVEDAVKEYDPKAFVIACNTATSAAIKDLRRIYDKSIMIGIEPALKPAVFGTAHPEGNAVSPNSGKKRRILVLATPITISEEKFQKLLSRYEDEADIIPLACPGLMELAESGDMDDDKAYSFTEGLLSEYSGKVDAAVLGCTHYPFLKNTIGRVLSLPAEELYDGGEGTARELSRRLSEEGLLRSEGEGNIIVKNSLPGEAGEERNELCKKLMTLSI